eukprot:6198682-Pleurochrysis_carterae.AAC.1
MQPRLSSCSQEFEQIPSVSTRLCVPCKMAVGKNQQNAPQVSKRVKNVNAKQRWKRSHALKAPDAHTAFAFLAAKSMQRWCTCRCRAGTYCIAWHATRLQMRSTNSIGNRDGDDVRAGIYKLVGQVVTNFGRVLTKLRRVFTNFGRVFSNFGRVFTNLTIVRCRHAPHAARARASASSGKTATRTLPLNLCRARPALEDLPKAADAHSFLSHIRCPAEEGPDEQCTYAQITQCDKEGLAGQALRNCYQCGSEGLHHHMCAVSEPRLQKASAVPNSTSTLCAVCANILTLAQVTMTCTDAAAAKLVAQSESNGVTSATADDNCVAQGAEQQVTKPTAPSNAAIEIGVSAVEATAMDLSANRLDETKASHRGVESNNSSCDLPKPDVFIMADEDPPQSELAPSPAPAVCSNPTNSAAGVVSYTVNDGASSVAAEEPQNEQEQAANASNDGGHRPVEPPIQPQDAAAEMGLAGCRVRETPADPNLLPRKGVVYMQVGSKFSVAFDDYNWRSYPVDKFSEEFVVITADDNQDMGTVSVRSVLVGRKGSLNLPSGYLLAK